MDYASLNSTKSYEVELTWDEIIKLDTSLMIKKLSKSKDKNELIMLEFYKKIEHKKLAILKVPVIKQYIKHQEGLLVEVGESYNLAKNVMLEEKKLFNKVYDKKESIKANDPCSKIAF